jgi:hypothetical protein
VQTISRKDRDTLSTWSGILRDLMPDDVVFAETASKRKSELHGDMQRVAEMPTPHLKWKPVEQQT